VADKSLSRSRKNLQPPQKRLHPLARLRHSKGMAIATIKPPSEFAELVRTLAKDVKLQAARSAPGTP